MLWIASALGFAVLLVALAPLGARRTRRAQSAYYVKVYFGRLAPPIKKRPLALLDEAVRDRRG
jgi:hypothetical protein